MKDVAEYRNYINIIVLEYENYSNLINFDCVTYFFVACNLGVVVEEFSLSFDLRSKGSGVRTRVSPLRFQRFLNKLYNNEQTQHIGHLIKE